MDIRKREKMVQRKAHMVRKELEAWALDQKILDPGDHVVFSLRIEKKAFVLREECDTQTPQELKIHSSYFKKEIIPIAPARVSCEMVEEIISAITYQHRKIFMRKLLVENKNKPTLVALDAYGGARMNSYYDSINRECRKNMHGKYLLLRNVAPGTLQQHFYQLYITNKKGK